MAGIWIIRVLHMPLVLSMLGFGICQSSEYVGRGYTGFWVCLNNSSTFMNMPEYFEICVNVSKSAWMAFVLTRRCNSLSIWTCGYLFQCLCKTRCFNCMFLSCHVSVSEWIYTLYLPACQGTPCAKQVWCLKFKWLQRDSNPQPLSS